MSNAPLGYRFFKQGVYLPLVAWTLVISNMLFAMSIDMHLPALPNMVQDLKTTENLVQMVFIAFFLGAVFARLLWGPVSDIYGRRKVLLWILPLQIIAVYECIIVENIYQLLFWRFVQALGSGVVSVVGTAIIADLFTGKERVKYYGLLEISMPFGFIVAPLLGAELVLAYGTWRASFVMMLIFLICIWIAYYLFIPETVQKHTSLTTNTNWRVYNKFLSNKFFVQQSLVSSLILANYVLYVLNAPFIFISDFGLSEKTYALYYLIPVFCNLIGFALYYLISKNKDLQDIASLSIKLLILSIPAALLLAFGVLPATPLTISLLIGLQSMLSPLIIPVLTDNAMSIYNRNKGVASASLASIRNISHLLVCFCFSYMVHDINITALFVTNAFITLTAVLYYVFDFTTDGNLVDK